MFCPHKTESRHTGKVPCPGHAKDCAHFFRKTVFLAVGVLTLLWLIQSTFAVFSLSPPYFFQSGVFHKNYSDSFADFFNINEYMAHFSPYIAPNDSSYPPLNFVFALPFVLLSSFGWPGRILALILFFLVCFELLCLLARKLQRKYHLEKRFIYALCFSFVFSSGVLFWFERANYLFFPFALTGLFLLDYNSPVRRDRELALVFLAAAAAMKLYPAVFTLLLLKEKRFTDCFKTAGYAVLLAVLPFFLMRGGFAANLTAFLHNLFSFMGESKFSYDISAENTVRVIAYLTGRSGAGVQTAALVLRLLLFACCIVGFFFARKRWQEIAFCAFCIPAMIHPVYDYCLIFLFFPFAALLCTGRGSRTEFAFAGGFLLLFTPLQFGYILPYVIRELQYIGIQADIPNYMGLTVKTFLEGALCILLPLCLAADTATAFFRKRSQKVQDTVALP